MASAASNGTGRAPADPRAARTFVFTSCAYDPATGVARLGYRFDAGPELVERITFPQAPWPSEPARQAAFLRMLDLLNPHKIKYRKTAAYGHFGREDAGFTWETTDKAAMLREDAGI